MNIIFMGTPDFAAESLEALAKAGHCISLVVTKKDKPVGRGKKEAPSAVKKKAMELGIPVYQPGLIRKKEVYERLEELNPDMIVVAAFGQIIPKEILELPAFGCLNVHASLLPSYRGAAPIQWAIIRGEKTTGVTIMQMNEGLDTGDMLAKAEIEIADDETGGSLFEKLSRLGGKLLVETIEALQAGRIVPEAQPEKSPTPYAGMIQKADGKLVWEMGAYKLERLIRAMSPWPSAFSYLRGRLVKIWSAEVKEEDGKAGCPGEIVRVEKDGFFVQTGDGLLKIRSLQMEGKRRLDAAEFLRGYPLETGERFTEERE